MSTCPSRSILLVEDDEQLRRVLAREFRTAGHECVSAGSGERALAAWQGRAFDLLVTDIRLPGLDGVELAASICCSEHVPVILITGYRRDFSRKLACLAHAVVVEKPFPVRKLVALAGKVVAPVQIAPENGVHAEQQAAERAP